MNPYRTGYLQAIETIDILRRVELISRVCDSSAVDKSGESSLITGVIFVLYLHTLRLLNPQKSGRNHHRAGRRLGTNGWTSFEFDSGPQ